MHTLCLAILPINKYMHHQDLNFLLIFSLNQSTYRGKANSSIEIYRIEQELKNISEIFILTEFQKIKNINLSQEKKIPLRKTSRET